ncbi:hypothetical protein B0T17DRAFT_490725, partial [Bombardia bombarda]
MTFSISSEGSSPPRYDTESKGKWKEEIPEPYVTTTATVDPIKIPWPISLQQPYDPFIPDKDFVPSYAKREPLPKVSSLVYPVYWSHLCEASDDEPEFGDIVRDFSNPEQPLWIIPKECPRCKKTAVRGDDRIYNHEGEPIATREGTNLLRGRLTPAYFLCCKRTCWRWQFNTVPGHPIHDLVPRKLNENCCEHCEKRTQGVGGCAHCFILNIYHEALQTAAGELVSG